MQRFRAQVSPSHNSASFALKRTRLLHGLSTTYTKLGGRPSIVKHPEYGTTFRAEINAIKHMSFRFFEVSDSIEQYLLELYATMLLGLDLGGFETS